MLLYPLKSRPALLTGVCLCGSIEHVSTAILSFRVGGSCSFATVLCSSVQKLLPISSLLAATTTLSTLAYNTVMLRITVYKQASPIFFNVPEAREYLEKNGHVYPLRRKRKKGEGITMAREGTPFNFRELFQVDVRWIKDIEECSEEELGEYGSESGFKSVNEWCSRRGPGANSLYLVSKT